MPLSVDDFRRSSYSRDAGGTTARTGSAHYLELLRIAQETLPSYEVLLVGGTREVALKHLRPFVAYPEGYEQTKYRPYHAIRSVDLFCEFPQGESMLLGVIDLPGTDADSDLDGMLLAELRNQADMLFIVSRAALMPFVDSYTLSLADEAAAGARRSDFVRQIINRDMSIPEESFGNTLAEVKSSGERLGIEVLTYDIESAAPADLAELVMSSLAQPPERLASMDRNAVATLVIGLATAAAQVRLLAGDLLRWTQSRQAELPDEEVRLRQRVLELTNMIGVELQRVRHEYDELYESGALLPEFERDIERAVNGIREWVAHGLGCGSTEEWMLAFHEAESAHETGRELDRCISHARRTLAHEFRKIDQSLFSAIDRLWLRVAGVLRTRLTEVVVPAGTNGRVALDGLAERSQDVQARTLAGATYRLLGLPIDYGSIFTRIGSPVVRKIGWFPDVPESGDSVAIGGVSADSARTVPEHLARAARLHASLIGSIEKLTNELEREYRAEARRALLVLSAAIDQYQFSIAGSPEVRIEVERLTRSAQAKIWPDDLNAPTAKLFAELAVLGHRAAEISPATDQINSLAVQSIRL